MPVFVVWLDQFLGPYFLVLRPIIIRLNCLRVHINLQLINGHPGVDFVQIILEISKLLGLFTHRFLRTVKTFIWLREIDMFVINGSLNFVLNSSSKILTQFHIHARELVVKNFDSLRQIIQYAWVRFRRVCGA